MQIAGDVFGIVVVDEIEVANLRVDREGGHEQRKANKQIEPWPSERTLQLRLRRRFGSRFGAALGH
jgi:hypothetical protein